MRGREGRWSPGARSLVGAAALGASLTVNAVACGSVDDATPALRDAGSFEVAPPVHGVSPCGTCVAAACASERRGCAAEPSCTKYLACADACPTAPGGGVDVGCEEACPRPPDPAGAAAFDALAACRVGGPAGSCAACNGGIGRYRSPLLTQVCGAVPSPTPLPILCEGDDVAYLERCARCQLERCCMTKQACNDSSACLALRACTQTCPAPDVSTYDECLADHADALSFQANHFSCVVVRCQAECFGADPCKLCWATYCGDEYAALSTSPEKFLHRTCEGRCPKGDKDCLGRCLERYPAARKSVNDFALCAGTYCGEQCTERDSGR